MSYQAEMLLQESCQMLHLILDTIPARGFLERPLDKNDRTEKKE